MNTDVTTHDAVRSREGGFGFVVTCCNTCGRYFPSAAEHEAFVKQAATDPDAVFVAPEPRRVLLNLDALEGGSLLPVWLRSAAMSIERDSVGPLIRDLRRIADQIEAAYEGASHA